MATVDVEDQQLLIGGEWRDASSGRAYEKPNPFTGEPAGSARRRHARGRARRCRRRCGRIPGLVRHAGGRAPRLL